MKIAPMLAESLRSLSYFVLMKIGRLEQIIERAYRTEIGTNGYISEFDKRAAEERQLKPLNRFQRWLLKPAIEVEKRRRQGLWRQSVIEVTGEDPDDPDAA